MLNVQSAEISGDKKLFKKQDRKLLIIKKPPGVRRFFVYTALVTLPDLRHRVHT